MTAPWELYVSDEDILLITSSSVSELLPFNIPSESNFYAS